MLTLVYHNDYIDKATDLRRRLNNCTALDGVDRKRELDSIAVAIANLGDPLENKDLAKLHEEYDNVFCDLEVTGTI